MTTKTYSTKANARRALSNIGKAALCKAAELIQEIDGQFQFNLEAAEEIQNSFECDDDCVCEPKFNKHSTDKNPAHTHQRATDIAPSYEMQQYGVEHCPSCGVHLSNGVGIHAEEVNGKWVVHTKTHENWCMGCGHEFGPLLPGKTAKAVGTPHANMKTSLKLDRRVVCVETDEEFKNAYQMWIANPDWMTTGQQDRLTAQLYAAAKLGKQIAVEINGRSFHLLNVPEVN